MDASVDPWILKEGAAKPILTHPDIQHFTVAQLKDSSGRWNESLIHSSFVEKDVEAILNTSTSPNMCNDVIIWNYDPRGKFVVKSAYRLGSQISQRLQASPSSSKNQELFWKGFKKTKIPPKDQDLWLEDLQ